MDEIITFDKSLQHRLVEYLDILSRKDVLTVSEIKKEWSYFVEFSVDSMGWQAVWKIPRLVCEDLKISFPTIVLVCVEEVMPKTLSALVRVLAVQDDISIPEHHHVPLIQLWVTKEQDTTAVLDVQTTANSIDMIRFFYQNIFMPWDYEDEETSDWIGKHLESRLRLYYDIKNGVIPRTTAVHINALITQARRLQAKRERLENEMEQEGEIELDLDLSTSSDNKKLQQLVELHIKIVQIGSEIKLLENPLTRNILINKEQELTPIHINSDINIWLIAKECKIQETIDFLDKVKVAYPEDIASICSELSTTLDVVKTNDTVVICKGKHSIKSLGSLENGGAIKSFCDANESFLTSSNDNINNNIMLDVTQGCVTFENITIDASTSQCGLLIRSGKVIMKNCKMVGDGESSTHQGIIALSGSELVLENCEISKFSTAIVGNSGSKITLNNCELHNCHYGVKIYDKCTFVASNSRFWNCEEYGLCVETENCLENGEQKVGNFDVLNIIPDVNCTDVKGEHNFKGNVIVCRKHKFHAIKDLFSQTFVGDIHMNSEEHMEVNAQEN